MKFIQNLSIRNKLLLISLIPLAALLYFLLQMISGEIANRNRIQQVYTEVLVMEDMSKVLHQLQQERGYSLAYLLTRGKEKNELITQHEKTDLAIFNINQGLSKYNKDPRVLRSLKNLPQLRDKIQTLKIGADSIRNEFDDIISPLIDEVNKIFIVSRNPDVKNLLASHMFLLSGKEFYGQLRALFRQAILLKGFGENGFAEFTSLKGKYEYSLINFRKSATPELAALYDKKMEEPAIQRVRMMIDSAYYHSNLTRFPFSSDEWWVNGVYFLNTLKDIEDYSALAILRTAQDQLAEISASMSRSILIAVVVVLLILVILFYTIKSITTAIARIKEAADRITKGEVNLSLPVTSKDEIGNLAASFGELIQVTKEYSQAAEIIGKGDYTPQVRIRGNEDTLGIALNNMKNNLQQLSRENEIRTWLLKGNSELNDKMRGEKEVTELAREIINQLTAYLNAQIGTIYFAENGHFVLGGSYAFQHRKENVSIIKPGESLVGQAAMEKKPIIFSQIPDDYIKINSSLGSSSPRNIIVYPFFYDGVVKGVIEMGSAHEFSDLDIQFLDMVSNNIGIAFNTAESRSQLKSLLEETQRQAEELEAQQEELRQSNDDLQEKTNLLERSETELRAQQEELQQTNEELEEKANLLEEQKEKMEVAKMEVETKARELEVTSKYKSEFLANMSHELRTPLNSILILSQLLGENKNGVLGEKEIECAKNIRSSGSDLLKLINEILDLSKIEAGRVDLEITEINISELEKHLLSMFREVAESRAISFEVHHQDDLLNRYLRTDKQRLEQILRNLLSNAFKFTEKGGKVLFDISIVPSDSSFKNQKLHQLDEVIAFSVTDTGIGIPESKQGIVFEAFQQVDGSTKRKFGGTGLGLSISRELANALGGEIHLQSEEGKGSVFTLYLPLSFDPSFVVPTNKKIALAGAREKIPEVMKRIEKVAPPESDVQDDRYAILENDRVVLIVEDDVEFSKILLDFSRERGYKGIVAQKGNTGLSLARYYRPDAIILDMKLPVMDGAEVLKQLKNDPDLRHIPVQIFSGYDDRRQEGLELGAFDFIKKPVSPTDLGNVFERVEEFINKKLKKLLIVEDNPEQNKAIRELIGNGDVKTFSAYAGEEAFEIMLKENFDCIIVDLGLPDMSGFELLEKIKANSSLQKTPVIVYTGKDLNKEETTRLNKMASTVVLKTANSTERLLDETTLFLHRVESRLPQEKQQMIRKLHRTDEVLKNKKVLIVDDDVRNIFSLTNTLEEEEMQCISAENGNQAIKRFKEHPDINIILMDVMMPEMDGYEATREIRKMDKGRKLPIIAFTAKAMKGDREKCLEAGMSDYIAKPVDIEQLLSLLRVWLYH
jgi:CheY-like chemotaxis protein/HAMP domain-containing protein/putative methionine-R-sulfoxide reductase with GAF domain